MGIFKAIVKRTVKKDTSGVLKKRLEALSKMDVLVGIPAGEPHDNTTLTDAQLLYIQEHGVRRKSMREEMQPQLDAGTPYSKAYQLYLHEHGSPLWSIPPRPVLEPAIASVKPKISEQFQKAYQAALDGKDYLPYLNAAGMIGRDAAYNWFVDPRNNWPPNAPSTIKEKGSERPLIDTGEMRRAITWVVEKK
jgi:hypothetical protein